MGMRCAATGLVGGLVLLVGLAHWTTALADVKSYPSMAALALYFEASTTDEIALARSAAPASISGDADVLALGRAGYSTAIKGTNGFVCLVERSWAKSFADPEFWNPTFRAPTCYNRASASTVLPRYIERTEWVLAGVPKAEMLSRTRAQISAPAFALPATGAMSYMMSKREYLNDAAGHWRPHVMFYLSNTDAAAWGANLADSPLIADTATIFGQEGTLEPVTIFMVPLGKWSDGTPATIEPH
jgi:hypothetical protein